MPALHPIALESSKPTQQECSYPPHLLELLAVFHMLKSLRYPRQALRAAQGQREPTVVATATALEPQ
jgi:hypothetical protein